MKSVSLLVSQMVVVSGGKVEGGHPPCQPGVILQATCWGPVRYLQVVSRLRKHVAWCQRESNQV